MEEYSKLDLLVFGGKTQTYGHNFVLYIITLYKKKLYTKSHPKALLAENITNIFVSLLSCINILLSSTSEIANKFQFISWPACQTSQTLA